MIVTDGELRTHAGLTDDAPGEDLALLTLKGEAAQNHIERLLGFGIVDRFGEDDVPPALREAVLQLAVWWFDNREAASDRDKMLPFGVEDIVNEYKDWAF